MTVYVRSDGCVRLGAEVCCDGFIRDVPIRVQSHAHYDHLKDFERSKGAQSILLAEATLDLLIAEFNADLPYRSNVFRIPLDGKFRKHAGISVALYPSGHIPGGALPVVDDPVCGKVMYASDFSWPLAELPTGIEALVVDATYGDPCQVRTYTQEHVKSALLDLVRDELRTGRVVFTGHRGRLQHAAQLLIEHYDIPFIFSKNALLTLPVFMAHRGFRIDALEFHSASAASVLREGERCFVFAECRDRAEIDQLDPDRRVYLSPYMVPREEPVAVHGRLIRVAMTDHADFNETIELIRRVAPARLIADNTRGGNADALAQFVACELGIPATAESRAALPEWGLG